MYLRTFNNSATLQKRCKSPCGTSFELIKNSDTSFQKLPVTLCSLMFSLHCTAALGRVLWLLKIAIYTKGEGRPADILPSSPSTISVRRSGAEDAAWQEFHLYDQRRQLVGAIPWLVLFPPCFMNYRLSSSGQLCSVEMLPHCAHKQDRASCH